MTKRSRRRIEREEQSRAEQSRAEQSRAEQGGRKRGGGENGLTWGDSDLVAELWPGILHLGIILLVEVVLNSIEEVVIVLAVHPRVTHNQDSRVNQDLGNLFSQTQRDTGGLGLLHWEGEREVGDRGGGYLLAVFDE